MSTARQEVETYSSTAEIQLGQDFFPFQDTCVAHYSVGSSIGKLEWDTVSGTFRMRGLAGRGVVEVVCFLLPRNIAPCFEAIAESAAVLNKTDSGVLQLEPNSTEGEYVFCVRLVGSGRMPRVQCVVTLEDGRELVDFSGGGYGGAWFFAWSELLRGESDGTVIYLRDLDKQIFERIKIRFEKLAGS